MESTEFDLGLAYYWLVLKRRWLPAILVLLGVVTVTTLASWLQKPTYRAEGVLRFERLSATPSLTGLGKEVTQLDSLQQQNSPVDTEAEVLRSTPLVQATIARLDLRDPKGQPLKPGAFQSHLQVNVAKTADVLTLAYTDTNPKQAAAAVQTLMEVYLEGNQKNRNTTTLVAREFIEQQLPKAEGVLRQAERQLRQFKEDNRIISLKDEAPSAVSMIFELQKRLDDSRAQLADVEARFESVRNRLGLDPQTALALTTLSQSPGVQEVLQKLQQAESQLAIERSRYRGPHPRVLELERQLVQLQNVLQERVSQISGTSDTPLGNLQIGLLRQELSRDLVTLDSQRQGIQQASEQWNQTLTAYKERMDAIPYLEQEQRRLERQLDLAQTAYNFLSQKVQELRVSENQKISNARILSSPVVPEDPIGPNRKLFFMAGLLLGALAGLSTAVLLEMLDQRVRSISEARQMFGLKLLGVIPLVQPSSALAPSHLGANALLAHSPFYAAYQTLRANLRFLDPDRTLKILVVSSSVPGEGKSTVCAHLAAAIARSGQRVLLIDADLHRPQQQKLWKLSGRGGLVDLLTHQTEPDQTNAIAAPQEHPLIQPVYEHLEVLGAGQETTEPILLLDSPAMATLLQRFAKTYDLVLLDTPPIYAAADALMLGKLADGLLLVVRPGTLEKLPAMAVKDLLHQSHQKVLGMVINGIVPANEPQSARYFTNSYYALPAAKA